MEIPHPNEQCSAVWHEDKTDEKTGHEYDTHHACIFSRGIHHAKADLMAIGSLIQMAADRVNLHQCSCGVVWLERTRMERRIQ
jgi:hypothetical protein